MLIFTSAVCKDRFFSLYYYFCEVMSYLMMVEVDNKLVEESDRTNTRDLYNCVG